MKLLFCPKCADVRKLGMQWTKCACGKSQGRYIDDLTAEIKGATIPLGIHNQELVQALHSKPYQAYAKKNQFTAWVIAEPCDSVWRVV